MAQLPIDLEIERIMNLVRGFGWEKVKQEVKDNEITLVLKKSIPAE